MCKEKCRVNKKLHELGLNIYRLDIKIHNIGIYENVDLMVDTKLKTIV